MYLLTSVCEVSLIRHRHVPHRWTWACVQGSADVNGNFFKVSAARYNSKRSNPQREHHHKVVTCLFVQTCYWKIFCSIIKTRSMRITWISTGTLRLLLEFSKNTAPPNDPFHDTFLPKIPFLPPFTGEQGLAEQVAAKADKLGQGVS